MQRLFTNNPYRIAGLLVGATAREQNRQIKRLMQYIYAEQEVEDDFSFPVFGKFQRTETDVERATAQLSTDRDKLIAALFWFWNGNAITDEAAFDSLRDGDIETAYQIWDKLVTETKEDGKRFWKPVTEKNYSAFHNYSVINIIRTNGNFHNAVVANLYFLESDLVHKFVSTVADETHKTTKKELQLLFLNQLQTEIEKSDRITSNKLLDILTKKDFLAKDDFLEGFVRKPIEQIEKKVEDAKIKRKATKENGINIGEELIKQTAENLRQLQSTLGISNVKYSSIADKVANEILQCSIDYFNYYQENESDTNYFEPAWKLAKSSEIIAIGKLAKDRILDSLNTLEEMKDKEILRAIQLLQSIKDAFEENRRNIKQQVKELEETDIEIRLGRKSINHRVVEENIKNSINWQNVNELLATVLSDNNLKKIKGSESYQQKGEFLELANWLKDNSLKSSIITIIINKYKKIPPKLPFKILSSEVTNTDDKPLYTKFIRYIGLNINIETTEEKTVTLYLKYINPNGSLRRNSETSPSDYSRLETLNINSLSKSINISGWGNSDKCIYDIGKHRIEVYVDEYLIHSKVFSVDLAPSEKLEIELKRTEDKLIEIKNNQYFKSELETLNSQMNKIKEWQFLRSQSERVRQIKEQQQKIDNVSKRADNEKASQVSKQQSIVNEIKLKIQQTEY